MENKVLKLITDNGLELNLKKDFGFGELKYEYVIGEIKHNLELGPVEEKFWLDYGKFWYSIDGNSSYNEKRAIKEIEYQINRYKKILERKNEKISCK